MHYGQPPCKMSRSIINYSRNLSPEAEKQSAGIKTAAKISFHFSLSLYWSDDILHRFFYQQN